MRVKLAAKILIPLIILIITAVMAGVSFAWFSDSATAEIATLDLATQSVFQLTFTNEGGSVENLYNGQTGFDKNGHIVCDDVAREQYKYAAGTSEYDRYMADGAYCRATKIGLDTMGRKVDIALSFDKFSIINRIYKEDEDGKLTDELIGEEIKYSVPNTPQEGEPERLASDIGYLFTWYIADDKHPDVMYTPYGTVHKTDRASNGEFPDKPTGIVEFTASADAAYTLYIVFAPERLYWMQYFNGEDDKSLALGATADKVYAGDARADIIYDKANNNNYTDQIFYSTPIYTGMDYDFAMTLTVTKVYDEEAAA